ncbi:hypothetical protein [Kribbella caucasensis]|nr:hypothetical protein [Kribbella sp. VKM Ac-2527]
MFTASWVAGLVASGLVLLLASRSMAQQAATLRQTGGPGIVAFELAGTTAKSREILTMWGLAGRHAAKRNLYADFPFIIGYVGLLAIPAWVSADTIGNQTWHWAEGIGLAVAIAAVLAGVLDIAEDLLLLSALSAADDATNDLQPQTRAGQICALTKFTLIAFAITWLIIVAVPVVLTAVGTA